jgi:cytochrome P450
LDLILSVVKNLLLFVILPYVLLLSIKDITSYLIWRFRYKSQGIKYIFVPIIGHYYFYNGFNKLDAVGRLKKLFVENYYPQSTSVDQKEREIDYTKECIMFNDLLKVQPTILVFGKNMLKELLMKENDFVSRTDPLGFPTPKTFFFNVGPQAMQIRA